MLEIGQTVMYAGSGVCTVTAVEEKDLGIGPRQYYALTPHGGARNTYYIPCSSPAAQKLSPLLSPEAMEALLQALPALPAAWVDSDTARHEQFRRVLGGTDRTALATVAKSLLVRRELLRQSGRHLRAADEKLLNESIELLAAECAAVSGSDSDTCRARLLAAMQQT